MEEEILTKRIINKIVGILFHNQILKNRVQSSQFFEKKNYK